MRRWAWLWLPIAFFAMCAAWALTSPPGSSPDDDYHLSSIWCAQGIQSGVCEESPTDPKSRLVPANVVKASDCYRFESKINAGCVHQTRDDATLVETTRVNVTAHLYPGLYYRVMSVFVGPDVERSVLLMRLANIALASLLLALMLRVVPAGIRSATLLTITVLFVPLGIFLVASTNPSGWAIVGVSLFWAFALALVHRHDWRNRRTWLIAGGTVLTAVMAIGSRVDAAAYIVLAAIVVGLLAGFSRLRAARASAILIGVLALVAAAAYLTAGTPGSGVDGETLGTAEPGLGLLLTNAAYLPVLFQGIVGGWALGWNDTIMPPLIPVFGTLVMGALIYRGLTWMDRRKAAASLVSAAALVLIPLAFLQKEGLGVGEVVQPRYVLPLMAILLATLGLGPRIGVPLAFPRLPATVIGIGLAGSAVLAFWANAHRYFAGSGFGLFDPKVDPAWVSSSGIPLAVTVIVGVAGTVAFVGGAVLMSRPPLGEHEPVRGRLA
jgi:hypothetical protein